MQFQYHHSERYVLLGVVVRPSSARSCSCSGSLSAALGLVGIISTMMPSPTSPAGAWPHRGWPDSCTRSGGDLALFGDVGRVALVAGAAALVTVVARQLVQPAAASRVLLICSAAYAIVYVMGIVFARASRKGRGDPAAAGRDQQRGRSPRVALTWLRNGPSRRSRGCNLGPDEEARPACAVHHRWPAADLHPDRRVATVQEGNHRARGHGIRAWRGLCRVHRRRSVCRKGSPQSPSKPVPSMTSGCSLLSRPRSSSTRCRSSHQWDM